MMSAFEGQERMKYTEGFEGPMERQFSPYTDNGGSIVAIGGQGFAVIASDTRLSSGYSILTREQGKLCSLNKKIILGATGCWCDVLTLTRIVQARIKMYQQEHTKDMSVAAVAQMVSVLLYSRRFFPYYVSNVVAGLDENEHGVIYSYDPVGHCEKEVYHAGGSSGSLLQPLLDSQIGHKNMTEKPTEKLTLEKAIRMVKDVFTSAAERDIQTGDGVIIRIITKDGIQEDRYPLRID
uniref:Proteasome subunit beta type n=1 Tax=Isotomurus palustris TaxID=36144 RepID=A0A481SVD5_9HEXA|nr:proteasome subunit beta type [Isotomurus palustris]